MRKLFRRLAWWLNRDAHEAELAEELAAHEEMKRRDLEAGGLSPAVAIAAGRREMGNTTFMREQARSVWIWPWLERLGQDIRYALRSARKNPTFSLAVIGITALGIGATTTIFSVVDGVLLRPLPYPAADRLIFFDWGSHSPPRFRDWQRSITSVEMWAAAWGDEQDLVGDGGNPERLSIRRVNPDYFTVFGGRPQLGRLFGPGDFHDGNDAAVVSAALWRRRFGGDSAILGRVLDLGGRRVTVVGVMNDAMTETATFARRPTDVWFPLAFTPAMAVNFHYSILEVFGRLKPGITIAQARQEFATLAPRLFKENPDVHGGEENKPFPIPVLPLQKASVQNIEQSLQMLFAAVGLMLLIACANVTNLYLARGTDRYRELAVRAALGAGRGRLTRQLVTESATLGVIAGVLGVALAVVGVPALASRFPGELPQATEVGVDGRVLAFAIVTALVTGLLFGLVPAWMLRERRAYDAIKAAGPVSGRNRGKLRGALVVAEVALALVLLVGSGLLFHSFLKIIQVDPGFDPSGLVIARLQLRDPDTEDESVRKAFAARRLNFARDVSGRIRALPGVTGVTIGVVAPMARTGRGRCCWGHREVSADDGKVFQGRIMIHPIGPGYFSTIGARLKGQEFGDAETFAEPYPAVLSNELAVGLFGTADPIGRRIKTGENTYLVRGVVTDLHQWGLDQSAGTEIFLPYDAVGGDFNYFNITVRSSASAAAMVPAIRQAIWAIEPTLPADDIKPMEDLVRASLAGPRFFGTLMGAFAGLALILAAAGIYASMLYSVRQRNRELGIRAALGARANDIARMVVGDASRLAIVGVGLGLAGAVALAKGLGAFLFGVSPGDPLTFGVAAAILGATVLVAAWLPARRAGKADPLAVLRAE